MADRYWVGGTGTWTTTTTNWSATSGGSSGASAPTAADSVFFDQAATYTVTMTGALTCLDITVSAGTVTFATGTTPTLAVSGNMSLLAGTVWNSTGLITFNPVANKTISTNGVTINASITFTPTPTTVTLTLNTALTMVNTGTFTLTQGILILNNFTLTTGIFNTNATNVRQIQFGTGNIALVHPTAATTVLVLSNYTNFTCSGTGGFTTAMTVTRTFNISSTGITPTNVVSLALTSGTSVPTFAIGFTVNHLDFTGSSISVGALSASVNSLTLSSGGTYTSFSLATRGTGTINTNGKTILDFTVVLSSGNTTTLAAALTTSVTGTTTLSTGTLNLAGFSITTGIFSSTNTFTRAIAFGTGNIVLSHTTAATTVLLMSAMTGFSWTGTGGFTVVAMSVTRSFSVGVTNGGTSSNAPNLTFTTGASVATLLTGAGGIWFNKLDFGTTSFTPTVGSIPNLNALTLSSTGTYTSMSVKMVGTGTITPNGKTIAAFTVNSAGTTTLAAALSCTTYTQTAGTIDFATFNLTCSGAAAYTAGTLSNIGTISCTTWTVTGTFTLSQGTITPSTSFVLTSGAFNYNGGTLSAVPTFTHTAGTATFNVSYALTATGTYTHTAGALILTRGSTLATGIFSSSGSGTRSISFGSSISSTTGSLYFSGTTFTNTTNSAFTSATEDFTVEGWAWMDPSSDALAGIICSVSGSSAGFGIARDYGGGILNANGSGGVAVGWLSSLPTSTWFHFALTMESNTLRLFKDGVLQGTAINTYSNNSNIVSLATRYAGGSSWPFAGYLSNIRIVRGVAVYTAAFTPPALQLSSTQSANTNGNPSAAITGTQTSLLLNTAYGSAYLTDSSTYNSATTSSSLPTSNRISPYLSDINLTHTTAATTVLSMATATGFTYTGTGGFTVAAMSVTRTFTFGSTAGGTTSNAPRLTFTTGASVATLTTASWFNTLDFGTTSFNPGTTALNVNGLTLSSSGTYTALTPTMVGTGTITSNAKTIAALTVNSAGTATLPAALTMSGALTLTQGILACSVYNVQSATFVSSGVATRSMTGSGTYTITGSGVSAFSNASAAGITITGLIISMTSASAKTFAGGGGTYPTLNQGGAGALTISGNNSFADLTATTRPSTITFTISTTQTFTAFTLSGTLGNLVTINSSTASTQATLSKSSGTVSVDYLSIQDSNATGGASWYAGANSTNVSNNTGWIFTAPPAPSTGNFFLFF